MADTKISALAAVASVAGANEFAVNEAGTSKKATADQIKTFIGGGTVTAVKQTADHANATTTATSITSLETTVGVGTWVYKYLLIVDSSVTTAGPQFSVQHAGTPDLMLTSGLGKVTSAGGNTLSTSVDQVEIPGLAVHVGSDATGGSIPFLGVNTAGQKTLVIIEGVVVVSVSGLLKLFHKSDEANTTTVYAGSSLILTKIA